MAAWNAGVFSLIRQLSETVILPIAGLVLTFVATYELIHSCATMLLQESFSLQEIQHYLGHATYQTTLRYAHLDTACRSSASDRMEKLIAERSEK